MRKLKITIQYDGSSYHGWQVQKNAVTVQEVFQDAVEKVFLKPLAPGIVNGDRYELQPGGGICQVTTTLYNALL